MRAYVVLAALLGLFIPVTASCQGWQTEQLLSSPASGQTDQKSTCGRMPSTTVHICVFEYGAPGSLHLYEVQSFDGGVSWTSPVQITSESTGEFDPFIAVDASRGRLWMVYSRNAPPGNDLVIRYKPCYWCSWSGSTTIIADGHNHWDASLVVAGNGDLLALEQLEGFGGTAQAKIRSIRSTNGGASWGSPVVIFDEPGEESFPRGLQKSDGVIHLMFRDTSHGSFLQIGQLWSSDYGNTWSGHSVFSFNFSTNQEFDFIGTQGGVNITVIAIINGLVNHWTSWDNGNTWGGPFQVSTTLGEDAEMSLGCRGPIFTFADRSFNVKERRYDWTTTCQ